MRLSEFQTTPDELIIGSRLRAALADVAGVGYFKLDEMRTADARRCRVLVTGDSDYPVNAESLRRFGHTDLVAWFGQNVTLNSPRFHGRPIGHQEPVTKILGETSTLTDKAQETKDVNGLMFINWRDGTSPDARTMVRTLYQDKPWTTVYPWQRDGEGYRRYLDGIYRHKFVACPRGNGIDTVRLWDSLVLRSVPIVRRCHAMSFFEALPILWVDDWAGLTAEYLEGEYMRIMGTDYDLAPLTLTYWVDRIKAAAS